MNALRYPDYTTEACRSRGYPEARLLTRAQLRILSRRMKRIMPRKVKLLTPPAGTPWWHWLAIPLVIAICWLKAAGWIPGRP